jgi:hypothetical protein
MLKIAGHNSFQRVFFFYSYRYTAVIPLSLAGTAPQGVELCRAAVSLGSRTL